MLLATLGALRGRAALPGAARLASCAIGAALAANPLAVRGAWFGTADAPALLALVLAFALLARGRLFWAAASLGAALLLKQFALVAVPVLRRDAAHDGRPAPTSCARAPSSRESSLAAFLPFLVADPGALWDDTIAYGADTYRILGYGLSALLLNLGVIDDRFGYYPFLPLAVARLATADGVAAVASQRRSGAALARSGRLRRLDLRAPLPQPGVPELVPGLAP